MFCAVIVWRVGDVRLIRGRGSLGSETFMGVGKWGLKGRGMDERDLIPLRGILFVPASKVPAATAHAATTTVR